MIGDNNNILRIGSNIYYRTGILLKDKGTTSERPNLTHTEDRGFIYFNTDINKPEWYDGDGNWVSIAEWATIE